MICLLFALWILTAEAILTIPVCLNTAATLPPAPYKCPLTYIPSVIFNTEDLACCPPDDILTPFYCAQEAPLPVRPTGDCPDSTYVFARTGEGSVVCCLESLTVTARPPGATTPSGVTNPPATNITAPVITPRTPRPLTTARPRCVDLVNPRTGFSDCPARAMLCNDGTYYDVMTKNCPRTCGRCSTGGTVTVPGPGTGIGSGKCVDLVNKRTGVSDCPSLAYLCQDATYYNVMTTNCPRTCGRCTPVSGTVVTQRPGTGIGAPAPGGTGGTSVCVDARNPYTGQTDCAFRRHLCRDYIYSTLMRTQCPVTCGFC